MLGLRSILSEKGEGLYRAAGCAGRQFQTTISQHHSGTSRRLPALESLKRTGTPAPEDHCTSWHCEFPNCNPAGPDWLWLTLAERISAEGSTAQFPRMVPAKDDGTDRSCAEATTVVKFWG